MNKDNFLSVSEVNSLVKETFDHEEAFQHLLIKAEIASWKEYDSAIYFDIKDKKSVLSCIMWQDDATFLTFSPKIGDEVLLEGFLGVYAPRGRYQFYAKKISLYGQGLELLKLLELKKKLEKEGLFLDERKKQIPAFPTSVGLITGDGSAAEADLIKNLSRRWPLVKIVMFPSLVQGKEAPKDLLRALSLAELYKPDVLIIARGGGSNEDLSAFNDETFVRAVAACPIPTISAIGHEIDFTLTDFVADARVSTPTGAAERATPSIDEINEELIDDKNTLDAKIKEMINSYEEKLLAIEKRPFFLNPSKIYQNSYDKLDNYSLRLSQAMSNLLKEKDQKVEGLEKHLQALNPKGVISRGYSFTSKEDGKPISSVDDLPLGSIIKSYLKDGIIMSKVEGKKHD